MKQTNSAIKFLIAQYRAIFRNANKAMLTALATAAALAASQAGAAHLEAAGWADLAGDKTAGSSSSTDFENVTLTATDDAPVVNNNAFTLTIKEGAAHAINGNNSDKGGFIANSGSFAIETAGEANATKIAIGSTKKAEVTFKGVSVTGGTIEIDKGSSLTSLDTFELGNKSAVTITEGNVNAASIELQSGSNFVFNKGVVTASGVNGGAGIKILEGATFLSKATAADDAKIIGAVSVDGGTFKIGDDKHLTVNGEVTVNSGKVLTNNGGSTANFNENVTFSGPVSFVNSGTSVFNKNVTFKDGSVDTAAENGTLKIGGVAFMGKASLDTFLSKATKVQGLDGKHAVIDLSSEADEIALGGTPGVFKTDDGTLSTKLVAGSDGSLTLKGKKAKFAAFNEIDGDITLDFDTLTLGSGSALEAKGGLDLVVHKALSIDGGDEKGELTISSGSVTFEATDGSGSLAAKSVDLSGAAATDAKFAVNKGTWEVNTVKVTKGQGAVTGSSSVLNVGGDLTITEGKIDVLSGGKLNVTGKLTTKNEDNQLSANDSVISANGDLELKANGINLTNGAELVLKKDKVLEEKDGKLLLVGAKFEKNAVKGSANSEISIVDANNKLIDMSITDFNKLKEDTGFTGMFNIKDLTGLEGEYAVKDKMNIGKVASNASTDAYNNITVTSADSGSELVGSVSVGNVALGADADFKLDAGDALHLNKANADGQFISKSGGKTAGVVFDGADNALTLAGSGSIESVTVGATPNANAGIVTIGKGDNVGVVTVNKGIGAADASKAVKQVIVNKNADLVVGGGVYTEKLELFAGSSLTAGKGQGDVIVGGGATINGSVAAGKLSLSGVSTIAGDSELDLGTLVLNTADLLTIGDDDAANEGKNSTSASVFVDKLAMKKGGQIFVDPAWNKKAAVLAAKEISNETGTDVGVVDGNIYVGQNAAFGYGFDQADFEQVMDNYLVDGKFTQPGEGVTKRANALVLNKALTLKKGAGIIVDHTLKSEQITATGYQKPEDKLVLGKNAGLIITEDALSDGKAAITFGAGAADNSYTATVTADESAEISLVGAFTKNSTGIKIFDVTTPTPPNPSVPGAPLPTATLTIEKDIKVKALGGLLDGVLTTTSNGTLDTLKLADNAKDLAYTGVARPLGDYFMDMAEGKFTVDQNQVGMKFVFETMNTAGGFPVLDTVVHAATYAGAQQAAVASVTTMADAMFGRVGSVGVESAAISATGSQANGGVWLTPMYKSVDADGFNAEGVSYGADVDVAGVAFGTDTVNGNMRFGAVFNIGSGESDGKGHGNGLKDEFDYYGFGIYSAMGFGSLAIVGDASLTVISHDVEGLGLKGKADTTAVTMGVTGQYTVATPAVDVTPHIGARFIRLDTDSYDLTSEKGVIATTDFDVQNVFSVPVGVTLSKAFVAGGWSLAPSADLSVTFNTGDTEAKSSTLFNGGGRAIGLNTEVLDEVTYGLTVGLGAQYGAFGTSFGINYTGSENTDSFGVNAQARYMF